MPSLSGSDPIGIFDSGIGGLTVMRAIMDRLPYEPLIYFGDTAHLPYGEQSSQVIESFTLKIADFLLKQRVKLLVMACNTMAAVAGTLLRAHTTFPVLDMIPIAAKEAVSLSKGGAIGIIATPATIYSNAYAGVIASTAPQCRSYSLSCPLFVPLVEEGRATHPIAVLAAKEYLRPDFVERIDTLILGCTHYPFLTPVLKKVVGNKIALVDGCTAMAAEVAALLCHHGLDSAHHTRGPYRCYVTDKPDRFQGVAEQVLGCRFDTIEEITL